MTVRRQRDLGFSWKDIARRDEPGRDVNRRVIRPSIETARTAHQVHTPEMTLNGDEAQVIWPMQDRVVWGLECPLLVGYGHYHERGVRRDGEWKLAAQRLTRLHMDVLPPSGAN